MARYGSRPRSRLSKRGSKPALTARKTNKKAKKRRLSKYKAAPLLKKLIRTEILDNLDAHSETVTTIPIKNTNGPIDTEDLHAVFDYLSFPKGVGYNNRIGDDCMITKLRTTFWLRCVSDPDANPPAGDLYLCIYIFQPKDYLDWNDWNLFQSGVFTNKVTTRNNFLRFHDVGVAFTGADMLHMDMPTNRDKIHLIKKYSFRVHNVIGGGQTSWFHKFSHNFKCPIKLKFNATSDKPYNFNPCIAVGFINSEPALNPDTSTRVKIHARTQAYWRG